MKDIEYTKIGDYYIPNIKASTKSNYQLGKYGRIKLAYLKEHDKARYQQLLLEGQLDEYLRNIDEEANNMYDMLLSQYKNKWVVTEELKERDQTKWVQEMNNIEMYVKEIILNTLIYN